MGLCELIWWGALDCWGQRDGFYFSFYGAWEGGRYINIRLGELWVLLGKILGLFGNRVKWRNCVGWCDCVVLGIRGEGSFGVAEMTKLRGVAMKMTILREFVEMAWLRGFWRYLGFGRFFGWWENWGWCVGESAIVPGGFPGIFFAENTPPKTS